MATRQRIDGTSLPNSRMFHARWLPPHHPGPVTPTLAAFIRDIEYDPIRNTPEWFPPMCETVAAEFGYKVLWCGDTTRMTSSMAASILPTTGSYLDQINRLGACARLAVGWNSGGLDMAAAAGLPILRIGEFQAEGPSRESSSTRKRYRWRAEYNSFLASATNIGLAPEYIDATLFSQALLQSSLRSFLAHSPMLSTPRHAILPSGVQLEEDWARAAVQLDVHSVPWPQ